MIPVSSINGDSKDVDVEEKILREEKSCKKCDHKWIPRVDDPLKCPKCNRGGYE